MLVISSMKCSACGKEFKAIQQHSQYYCKKCNNHFTLCPECKDSFVCDYCGCKELIDVYEHHRKIHGTDILF